jgi:HD superfamily phosphohydrolase
MERIVGPPAPKIYQDQVYFSKVLSPLAVAIIDTAEFQRLHGLKQLGFAYMAFRGATHTRFSHSVGTYFAARTLLRRIVQNHERLAGLGDIRHPGRDLSKRFLQLSPDSGFDPDKYTGYQGLWRGMTEVVSCAALLHDIGHVPFGHTFEDEYSGFFSRHDSLCSPRLYTMLFDPRSELAQVFDNNTRPSWMYALSNEELRRLIFVILSFKEHIEEDSYKYKPFAKLIDEEIERSKGRVLTRLKDLKAWHEGFSTERLYHPFMSDVVGNTICADLLDYLPRDQTNLGLEPKSQNRIQRYFFIGTGTDKSGAGLRLRIMVCRADKGGQRRDVATTVLDVMRERYEMAERVFYHHKKAAASAMLAELFELAKNPPRDGEDIYPAPWTAADAGWSDHKRGPHLVHLSDEQIIDYLGTKADVPDESAALQRTLWVGLRYRKLFRTLLVVDMDLAQQAEIREAHLADLLWGQSGDPKQAQEARRRRREVQERLAGAARAAGAQGEESHVLLYCPSASMQSKEIDARVELRPGVIEPLRWAKDFALQRDIEVLRKYYEVLWRLYIFVHPRLYRNDGACFAIIKSFAQEFNLPLDLALKKSRRPELKAYVPRPTEGPTKVPEFTIQPYMIEPGLALTPAPLGARSTPPEKGAPTAGDHPQPPRAPMLSDEEVFNGVMGNYSAGKRGIERLQVLLRFAKAKGWGRLYDFVPFVRFLRETLSSNGYPTKWVYSPNDLSSWFAEFQGGKGAGSKL